MAQCVLDHARDEHGYYKGADFLVGSALYSPSANCSRTFLRSMVDPVADGNRSSSCWSAKFDATVRDATLPPLMTMMMMGAWGWVGLGGGQVERR